MTDATLDASLSRLTLFDSASSADFHPSFNLPEADLVLVSSDGIKFGVHKERMASKSSVFADMLEVGEASEGVAEVPLTESGEVLEAMLRMCAEGKVNLDDLRNLEALDELSDKYQMDDVGSLQMCKQAIMHRDDPSLLVALYLTALCRLPSRIHESVDCLLASGKPYAHFVEALARASELGLTDDGQLCDLFMRRSRILKEERQALWLRTVGPTYRARKRDGLPSFALSWIYQTWQRSASVTSVEGLDSYIRFLDPKPHPDCFFCSNALRRILLRLPTNLE